MPEAATTSPPAVQPIFTTETLSREVESLVRKDHLTYIEAIMSVCDRTGIDPEDLGKLVAGSLKEKVEAEARKSNRLPRTNTLFGNEED